MSKPYNKNVDILDNLFIIGFKWTKETYSTSLIFSNLSIRCVCYVRLNTRICWCVTLDFYNYIYHPQILSSTTHAAQESHMAVLKAYLFFATAPPWLYIYPPLFPLIHLSFTVKYMTILSCQFHHLSALVEYTSFHQPMHQYEKIILV